MRLNIFLSLNLFLIGTSFAQLTLRGTLYEKGTKNLLADTNVFIMPYQLKATTDSEGKFIFPDVPPGEFEFIVNKSAYIRLNQKETTDELTYSLYLEKEYYDVFETVVTGKEVRKDVAKKTLSQKDFLKAPGAQEDPVKAIQNLPGVANQTFSSQVVIQGSEPDDTSYSINGHKIPLIFHFGGLTSVVTPTAVDQVEFLSAGFGPEYGRALGGIVNLTTRKPRADRWRGEGSIDITKMTALAEGPLTEKSSLITSARVSYFGKIFEKVAQDMDDFAVTAAPEFQDLYLNYDYKVSKTENFSVVAISSKDTLELIIKEGNNPNIEGDISNETTFNRIIPRYRKKINEKTKLDLSLAVGEDNLNFSLGNRFFDLSSRVITQRGELEHKFSEKLTSYFGSDIEWRKSDVKILLPASSSGGGVSSSSSNDVFAQIKDESTDSALYLRNSYKLDQKLTISPNIRAEYFSTTRKSYLMPRFNALYSLSDSLFLNFATGIYYQAPQNGENSEEFGNPDVGAEKSTHYLFSVVKDFRGGSNKGLTVDIGFFYKELEDLIVSTEKKRSDGTNIRNTNEGEGNIHGVQLQGSYKLDEYTILTSYTYLKSRRRDPNNGTYPSKFDQTHNLNLIGIYERSRWVFSSRIRFVTGSPYTPVESSVFDSDGDVYIPVRGDFYSQRFDDFFQLDFRIDRKFIYKTWILSAYLDIQNLTNANNGQGISYSYDYSQKEKAAGTPIIPIIGLRGEF
jgi:hypothetical protein